jgi:hypothetical protein
MDVCLCVSVYIPVSVRVNVSAPVSVRVSVCPVIPVGPRGHLCPLRWSPLSQSMGVCECPCECSGEGVWVCECPGLCEVWFLEQSFLPPSPNLLPYSHRGFESQVIRPALSPWIQGIHPWAQRISPLPHFPRARSILAIQGTCRNRGSYRRGHTNICVLQLHNRSDRLDRNLSRWELVLFRLDHAGVAVCLKFGACIYS